MNIHGAFQKHKRFFTVDVLQTKEKKKGSSKNKGSLRNPKWFFNGMTTKNLLKINEQEFKGILTCIYPFNIYFRIYHCTTQDFSSMKHLQTHCSTEKQPDKVRWPLTDVSESTEAGVLIGRVEE